MKHKFSLWLHGCTAWSRGGGRIGLLFIFKKNSTEKNPISLEYMTVGNDILITHFLITKHTIFVHHCYSNFTYARKLYVVANI